MLYEVITLGTSSDGEPVFLRDIWPSVEEVEALRRTATAPERYRQNYASFDQVRNNFV